MLKFIFVIIIIGISSCCVYPFKPYVRDINNLGIPKRDPFFTSKHPFISPINPAIDTNAIYLVEAYDRWYGPVYLDTFYYYYVFFQNGSFFKSTTFENSPSEIQINKYENGFIGQYRYNNDTTIITQVYYPIECGDVYTSFGYVYQDKIIMYQGSSNSLHKKYMDINILIKKVEVESLNLKPYWLDYEIDKRLKDKL